VGTRSGKSLLSIGLAMNYPGKVGFYKPFRENTVSKDGDLMDQDAVLLAELLGLEGGEKLSPYMYDIFSPVGLSDIVSSYNELSRDKEFMIIEGSRDLANGCSHGISHLDIAEAIGAPMVLVSSPSPQSLDAVFMFKHLCSERGIDLKGVVINKSTGHREREFLEKKGIAVIGEIPIMPELRTYRVYEITEKMEAKVIAGKTGMDNVVEEVIVGAMSPQVAVRYMRRAKKKAVITGGDRTEILLAALSTNTSCVIVTGGVMPVRTITSRADELGVPILLTNEDTLTAAETVDHLIARIDPKDTEKIDLMRKTTRKCVDLSKIW
jgi:BioD-like phosphotransacetylase family protein